MFHCLQNAWFSTNVFYISYNDPISNISCLTDVQFCCVCFIGSLYMRHCSETQQPVLYGNTYVYSVVKTRTPWRSISRLHWVKILQRAM